MKWTVDANNQIGALPYFARFRARRLIEEDNRKRNLTTVELEDVIRIKNNKEIKKLIEIDHDLNDIDYKQNLRINICGGIRGCRRSLFNDIEVLKTCIGL